MICNSAELEETVLQHFGLDASAGEKRARVARAVEILFRRSRHMI